MSKWFRGPFTEPLSEDEAYEREESMSETPRTDAIILQAEGTPLNRIIVADFTRQLERELRAAEERIAELKERIAQLTAPGEVADLQRRCLDYANAKDTKRGGPGEGTALLRDAATAIEQLQAQRREAEARLAEYKEDAERYRWLRLHSIFANDSLNELWFDPSNKAHPETFTELDETIDAARRKEGT